DALARAPGLTIWVGRPFEALRAAVPEGVLERKVIAETGEAVAADIGEDSAAVYDALTAIAVVGRTDMVALVPRRFAERDDARHVVMLDAPEESGGIDLMMLWHGKFDEDAGLAWLRGVIRDIVAGF
ncbi:MAG: hypothetical protein ACTHKR_10070, partial [Sphingomonas sp.]